MSHPWTDLLVWQRSHALVLEVYNLTTNFPEHEKFGLVQQVRGSSVSIASNIVEGKSKNTDKEFRSFLFNARGSLEETRYHLLLAKDLGYFDEIKYDMIEKSATEVSFLLNKLISSIAS